MRLESRRIRHWSNARESLPAAGERALALSAYAAAADFFADALALSSRDDPVRARMLLQRARALFPLGEAALDLLTEAAEGFRAAGDVEGRRKRQRLPPASRGSPATVQQPTVTSAVRSKRSPIAPSRGRAQTLAQHCGYQMLDGHFEEAIHIGGEALPLVEELGMEDQRARLHIAVGCARCGLGDPRGLDQIETGIRVAEAAGTVDMLATGYTNLSSELHFFGRLVEARHAYRQLADVAERYGWSISADGARGRRILGVPRRTLGRRSLPRG
ncbi:MAG: hypothetical protein ABR529_15325 [Actinomycetota bacterium]